MRASDYIGISEKIRSKELKLQGELSEIDSKISTLYTRIDSLESEYEILQMELNAALSETDEDGNVDMGAVGAIRARMSAVRSQINSSQSEASTLESEKQEAQSELQAVETEKQTTLSDIQSAATVKSQNMSKLAGGLSGDYAGVGQNLQSAFQVSLGQLSQAASILGGSISGGTGGGFVGTGSSSGKVTSSRAGNQAAVGGIGSKKKGGTSSPPNSLNPVSTTTADKKDIASSGIGSPSGHVTPSHAGNQAAVGGTGSKKKGETSNPQESLKPVSITTADKTDTVSSGAASKELTAKHDSSSQFHSQSPAPHSASSTNGGTQAGTSGASAIGSELTAKPITPLPKSTGQASPSSVKPHTFADYLNPVNYDSDGHYTGDYRTPAMQTVQAVTDYKSWNSNGGIGLPSTDLRKGDAGVQRIVRAQNIFDVYGSEDPGFWSYKSRPQSDYIAMAEHIPLVREYLAAGKTIADVEAMGGIVGACASNYFRDPVKVMKAGEAYIHCNDGRHRTVAAQIAKVEMPVCVVQEFHCSSGGVSSSQLTPVSLTPLPKTDSVTVQSEKKTPFFEKFVNFAEKYGETITKVCSALQVVFDGGNGYVEMQEKLSELDTLFASSSSYVAEAVEVSIPENTARIIGAAIQGIGGSEDAALKSPEDIKSEIDEAVEIAILNKNTSKQQSN